MARTASTAEEFLAFGARILVRHGRASLAHEGVANASVPNAEFYPWYARDAGGFKQGALFFPVMDKDFGARSLHDIANGPIMDPAKIYLPAGTCSEADWRKRNTETLEQLGRKP